MIQLWFRVTAYNDRHRQTGIDHSQSKIFLTMTVIRFIVEPYCWALSVRTTGYQGRTGFMEVWSKGGKQQWDLCSTSLQSQDDFWLSWHVFRSGAGFWTDGQVISVEAQAALHSRPWSIISKIKIASLCCVSMCQCWRIYSQRLGYGRQLVWGPSTTIYAPFDSMKKINSTNHWGCWHSLAFCSQ